MKGAIIVKGFIAVSFIITIPQYVLASDGTPTGHITFNHALLNSIQADTTLPSKKSAENTTDKPNTNIIKVVPKARRLPVPVPVKVKIKPVKIIKPKIIKPKIAKPVLKILH